MMRVPAVSRRHGAPAMSRRQRATCAVVAAARHLCRRAGVVRQRHRRATGDASRSGVHVLADAVAHARHACTRAFARKRRCTMRFLLT